MEDCISFIFIKDIYYIKPVENTFKIYHADGSLVKNQLNFCREYARHKNLDLIDEKDITHSATRKLYGYLSNGFLKQYKNQFCTLSELLIDDNFYRIDKYQRGYAWKEKEITDLLKDIRRLIYSSNTSKHYTGMLSLKKIDSSKENESTGSENTFYVVDGQQRLITFVLILKEILFRLDIDDNEYLFKNELPRVCYSKNRSDFIKEYFIKKVYNDEDVSEEDSYSKNLANALEIIKNYFSRIDDEDIEKYLETILNRIVFNIFLVTKEFDTKITFETINNRGKKLTVLEMLKNRLMFLTNYLNVEDYQKDNLIETIDNGWKEVYKNLSFDTYDLDDDEFLYAHWSIFDKLNKIDSRSFYEEIFENTFSLDNGKFFEHLKEKDSYGARKLIENYVKSLTECSGFWRIANDPLACKLKNNNNEINKYYKELDAVSRIIDSRFIKTVLMVVLKEKISVDDKRDFLKSLNKSLFINKLIGDNRNDYSSLVTAAKNLFQAEEKDKREMFKALNKNLENEEIKITKDKCNEYLDSFSETITKRKNLFYGWKGTNYILYEYEFELCKDEKMYDSIRWRMANSDSIEHILPQKSDDEYWTTMKSFYSNLNLNNDSYLNSLGNLLLLAKEKNSKLTNNSFNKKIAYYKHGSYSEIDIASNYEVWSYYEIYSREEKIWKFIFNTFFTNYYNDYDEFKTKLINNNLLVTKIENQLSNEQKEILKNTNPSTETVAFKSNESEFKKTLLRYFDEEACYKIFVSTASRFCDNKNTFTFKKEGNLIKCRFYVENKYYCFFEYKNDDDFEINIYYQKPQKEENRIKDIEEIRKICSNKNSVVNYFIRAFIRFIKGERIGKVDNLRTYLSYPN